MPRLSAGFAAEIDVFDLGTARTLDEIALNGPQLFKQRLAIVTHDWARHRLGAGVPAQSVQRPA